MRQLAPYNKVWKHKKTGKVFGACIDVKTLDELNEYEQITKPVENSMFIKKADKLNG